MNRILKIFLITLCWVVAGMTICNSSNATIYFYYDAEGGTVGEYVPSPPITSGVVFCQTECSGSGTKAKVQSTGGAPQGAKYWRWETVQNQTNAYTEVKNKGVFPFSCTLGKTYYFAFFIKFERIGGNDIWHECVCQSISKTAEIRGNGIRWNMSFGQWYECSPTEMCMENQDHHFTITLGNPTYHINPALEPYPQNQNAYSPSNNIQLKYETWYSIVVGVKMACDSTGAIHQWVNGVKTREHTNIQTAANCSPTIDNMEFNGTIAQPAYDAPPYYVNYDALMLTDNWQDIIDGGYLGGGGADTTPPGDVTNFIAQSGDRQVALSWTNPTDSDFKGTLIRIKPLLQEQATPIPSQACQMVPPIIFRHLLMMKMAIIQKLRILVLCLVQMCIQKHLVIYQVRTFLRHVRILSSTLVKQE